MYIYIYVCRLTEREREKEKGACCMRVLARVCACVRFCTRIRGTSRRRWSFRRRRVVAATKMRLPTLACYTSMSSSPSLTTPTTHPKHASPVAAAAQGAWHTHRMECTWQWAIRLVMCSSSIQTLSACCVKCSSSEDARCTWHTPSLVRPGPRVANSG